MSTTREIVEIQVKSVLNRVEGMPFRWSINPYRGCSHACPFCLSGETAILMADGTARRLDAIRVGDQIIGTVRNGRYRRFAQTSVLAHWSVDKPAFRVALGDGTELIAGEDHRFLSDRGWKFVTGTDQGAGRRPHLTVNTALIGTGAFAMPPTKDAEYERGYLCGMVRGDGLPASGNRRAAQAIATSARRHVETVGAIKHKSNGRAQPLTLKHLRLPVVSIEPLGIRRLFDMTTGSGDFIANGVVSHNCYARRTHWFLEEDGVRQWSSKIFVKVNAPEILRRELRRPGWRREEVALGTATDPYQAIEGRYRVTRRILEALCESRTPVGIVTRSPMIVRDLDLLTELDRRAGVTVCLSLATTDARIAREIEPTVALPARRLRAVQRLAAAGIHAGVILAPIVPGLTDDPAALDGIVGAAREHGAHFVHHNVLHLGEVTRDSFFGFLRTRHPGLIARYLRMYRGKYAPQAYRAGVGEIVDTSKRRHGVDAPRRLARPPEPAQLDLF